ncbi:MAG: hypothetical protein J7K54_02620 [Candidatus Aenigmarchaeota archaeon]|nr:hypothetical protein [Candidatus Aenigmarchaeota archaeon]
MGLFGNKNKHRSARYAAPGVSPSQHTIDVTSRDYRIFRKRTDVKLTWYEVLARFAGSLMDISFDEKTSMELKAAIDFTGLRIKPNAPVALFLLSVIFFSFASGFLFAFGVLKNVFGIALAAALGLGVGYYLMNYPKSLMKSMRIQASSQVVLAILYMVVSMRISPNVEGALKFTSSNISGVLAWDIRKLLWDIQMGRYYSANEAMMDYINKWKPENEEFSEALRLIMESQKQVPEKAEKTLDEALRVVLDGTRDRMKHYAQELQMPVTVIHMMGIVLPILGSVMAPMAAIFMADSVSPIHFIVGYNIVLPLLLIWFINNILSKRPVTFSKVDVSKHPNLPPKGTFMLKTGNSRIVLPVLPIALIIGLLIALPGILYFIEHPEYLIVPQKVENGVISNERIEDPDPFFSLLMSILPILGTAVGLSIFFIMSNYQRLRVEDSVYKMESEFELALFQLGNRISGGTPLEIAIEKANEDVKDLEISRMFGIILRNMRNFNMTFERALMDPQSGALRFYPSRLIQNVMRTITDTAKKGVQFASQSMLTVSRYLKNVRETQEYMRGLLSETTSSMQFQAYAMAPLVTGLIVAMSQVIIQVLVFLGGRLNDMGFQETFTIDAGKLLGSSTSISSTMFQIIVGFYLIEVIIIIAMFVTKVNRGDDRAMQWNLAGKMLMVSMIIYVLVAIGSSMAFGGMIEGAMKTLGA